jgi:hypothetical protein
MIDVGILARFAVESRAAAARAGAAERLRLQDRLRQAEQVRRLCKPAEQRQQLSRAERLWAAAVERFGEELALEIAKDLKVALDQARADLERAGQALEQAGADLARLRQELEAHAAHLAREDRRWCQIWAVATQRRKTLAASPGSTEADDAVSRRFGLGIIQLESQRGRVLWATHDSPELDSLDLENIPTVQQIRTSYPVLTPSPPGE